MEPQTADFTFVTLGAVEANRKVLAVVERVERVGAAWPGCNHGLGTVLLPQVFSQTDAIFRFFKCHVTSHGW